VAEYAASEIKADNRYGGRIFTVSGTIKGIFQLEGKVVTVELLVPLTLYAAGDALTLKGKVKHMCCIFNGSQRTRAKAGRISDHSDRQGRGRPRRHADNGRLPPLSGVARYSEWLFLFVNRFRRRVVAPDWEQRVSCANFFVIRFWKLSERQRRQ